jgi:hypothetical protein
MARTIGTITGRMDGTDHMTAEVSWDSIIVRSYASARLILDVFATEIRGGNQIQLSVARDMLTASVHTATSMIG